jgi:hypothetical protein
MTAIEQAIEALEAFNLTEDMIVSGTADSLLLRVPFTAIQKVAAALAALRGQADDAKDAQRYRWLTKYAYIGECFTDQVPSGVILEVTRTDRRVPDACGIAASVDTAIDAAIAAEAKGQSNA